MMWHDESLVGMNLPAQMAFQCRYRESAEYLDAGCDTEILVDATAAAEQVVVCPRCGTPYEVWVRQNRHTRSRNESDHRLYNLRLHKPDGSEELLRFKNSDVAAAQLDLKSGDATLLVFGMSSWGHTAQPEVNGQPWEYRAFNSTHPGWLVKDVNANPRSPRAQLATILHGLTPGTLLSVVNASTGQEVIVSPSPTVQVHPNHHEQLKLLTSEDLAREQKYSEQARLQRQEEDRRVRAEKRRSAFGKFVLFLACVAGGFWLFNQVF